MYMCVNGAADVYVSNLGCKLRAAECTKFA
jgi:hypothetical protein